MADVVVLYCNLTRKCLKQKRELFPKNKQKPFNCFCR